METIKEDIENKIQIIIKQSPIDTTEDEIKEGLDKNQGDVVKTIQYIWNQCKSDEECIELKNTENDEKFQEKRKWEEIRDICNCYESEMANFMKSQGYGK